MKKIIAIVLLLHLVGFNCHAMAPKIPEPEVVAQAMQRVADWQITHFRDLYSNKNQPHDIEGWTNAAFYMGVLEWIKITKDPRYENWLKSLAEKRNWQLGSRTYMADDHAVGQLYLELYRRYHDKRMLSPTQTRFNYILEHPSDEPISLDNEAHLERWSWCDALFMGPPVWAKLYNITGDERYKIFMMAEIKSTINHLFDENEHLFFRDNSYLNKRVNGKKVFWGRGNGWVFAGLTLVMDELPKNSVDYFYLLDIYKKMADKLLAIQTPQGHWAMSLLDAEHFPTPETSGSSFFVYGLAWGVNNGILKESKYRQAVYKGWVAVSSHITGDGMLGYVQPIGAQPGQAWPDKTETYGSGAFLAASAQVYRLIKGTIPANIADSEKLAAGISASNKKLDAELSIKNDPKRVKVFARYVPERADDFAWENDLVAFRAYGPALRSRAENAGIDVWSKRVPYSIINKWYALEAGKQASYHQDHGEGLDNYHVGASLGTGGSALYLDRKLYPLETYTRCSIHSLSEKSVTFTLTYKNTIGGDNYREDKRITLESGSQLYTVESRFLKNDKPASNLPIGVGVTTHDGKAKATFNQKAGWVSAWEVIDGFGLGTGVVMPAGTIIETAETGQNNLIDSRNAVLITRTNIDGKIFYAAGYSWEKANKIKTSIEWQAYLNRFAHNFKNSQSLK
jgi:rhamnogalacturonyl hydrolase YesR